MVAIEIDWEVRKALMNLRESEAVTDNDVLRRLLKLSPKQNFRSESANKDRNRNDWVVKGVRFPSGTEFCAIYKGQTLFGKVEGGTLVVGGRRFSSPSAAAVAITKNPVNGWHFWKCRLPGSDGWQLINNLRQAG